MSSQAETLRKLLLEKYEPIAIVGMGLRFPGGNRTVDEFAEFLHSGSSGMTPIPPQRWDSRVFGLGDDAGDEVHGRVRAAGGGFVDGLAEFDARFFNISPKEAQYVDPQQRLVLETAWEALEHANIDPTELRGGQGGVYIGVGSMDYLFELDSLPFDELDAHVGTGTAHSAVPGRLSYFLGWRGPSIAMDTACSSSLVSLHLAVEGLRRGECEIALAGGVNTIHHPATSIVFSEAGMLAPDGRCKTFDDSADGYARSEGCGMLVLKRLSDAKRDGDQVLALVRGSAVRQDGESAGLTVPNGTAQELVMRAAMTAAMVDPAEIQYVEAHGTGTPLGDPIEAGAISDVFAESHDRSKPVLVGSVKTNLGHMEIAAGVGGVVKTVLQMRDSTIYPHINMDKPSGRIPWDSCPIAVPRAPLPWPKGTRRALVNSFGFAGTIATVVLEQAPPVTRTASAPTEHGHVFTMSAKSPAALRRQARRYRELLLDRPDLSIPDLCQAVNLGRAHLSSRLAGEVRDRDDVLELLDREAGAASGIRKVAMLFTGQGAQHPGMAAALYQRYGVFREEIDRCQELFGQRMGTSLLPMLLGKDDRIHQTGFTQPALFTLEYATAKLWLSWGVRPNVLIGHSIGEIAAAAIAGLFSIEDAADLVTARARLMQSVSPPGGMLAVFARAQDIAHLVDPIGDVSFAAFNAPDQCVVAGGVESLARITSSLADLKLNVKELAVSHAFHSPLMADIRQEFRAAIESIRYADPRYTLISNLTGTVARPADLSNPDYWVRHMTEPVNFEAGMRAVERRGRHAFIEMGPGAELTSLGRRCVNAEDHLWLHSGHPADQDGAPIRRSLAKLYSAGLPVSWRGYHNGRAKPVITLPAYAFEPKEHWLPLRGRHRSAVARSAAPSAGHPLLGEEVPHPRPGVREFVARLSTEQPGYLADHVTLGGAVFPLSGYLELMLAAQYAVHGLTTRPILDLRVLQPLSISSESETTVHTIVEASGSLSVTCRAGEAVTVHATAMIGTRDPELDMIGDRLRAARDAGGNEKLWDAAELYADALDHGMTYGPAFRRVRQVRRLPQVAVGELDGTTGTGEHLPPTVMDSALQTVATLADTDHAYLPVGIEAFQLYREPRGERLTSLLRLDGDQGDDDRSAQAALFDGDEQVMALRGLRYRKVTEDATHRRRLFHRPQWIDRPLELPVAPSKRHLVILGCDDPQFKPDDDVELTYVDTAQELAAALGGHPTDVCWFWRAAKPDNVAELADECQRNYTNLLELTEVLDKAGFGRRQRLWLITNGVHDGSRPGAAATLWGFGQSLGNEYPSWRVTMLDSPNAALLDELRGAPDDETQVSYLDGTRRVRRLYPVDPVSGVATEEPAVPEPVGDPVEIRPDLTYLITGGLGALGKVAAARLVRHGARHVALISRRPAPPPDLGEGVNVTVLSGDIGSEEGIDELRAGLAELPPVGGVIHAAGVLADAPVSSQTWQSIDAVFGAKVYGTWLLDRLELPASRFFIGYSSIAAVLGPPAQSNYAAANAYLDAMCGWRARNGLPGLSVNWGPWAEVGMAAELNTVVSQQGLRPLPPGEAMHALDKVLRRPPGQVMIAAFDWAKLAASNLRLNAMYEPVATAAAQTSHRIDLQALAEKSRPDRQAAIGEFVRGILAEALHFDGPEDVEADAEFLNLGMDSLATVTLKTGLESALGLPLPASLTFDHPSVDRLAAFLDLQLNSHSET